MGFADPSDFQIAATNLTPNGPVPVDGLSAEVRQLAGGEGSRQADKRGAGCHPQGRRGISGGIRYALIVVRNSKHLVVRSKTLQIPARSTIPGLP